MVDYKQVILVRHDLKLPKGKMAAQAAHASVEAVLRCDAADVKKWHNHGMKKLVLRVDSEKDLIKYFQQAKDASLPCGLITDAGHTVVAPGTKTCVGIGPAPEEDIDAITSELKLIN